MTDAIAMRSAREPGPAVHVPSALNVAREFIDLPAERYGDALAYVCDDRRVSFTQLRALVNRMGNALAGFGVEMEQRVGILLPNVPEFVAAFFGAIKIGAVPIAISTVVAPDEQAFLLADSRARALIVAAPLWQSLRERRADFPFLRHLLVLGGCDRRADEHDLGVSLAAQQDDLQPAPTTCDDVAFWLHTSGSTGTPKWAVHLQRNMLYAEQVYARPFVGLRPGDVVLAGGPCFHAYALGLTTYFSLRAGATVVLNSQRSTPERVFELIACHRVTVLAVVPTLYAQLLQAAGMQPEVDLSSLRVCLSAAEPLPAELQRRWMDRFGLEILDGIGTTEALHIFISNCAGAVRLGSSGRAVPGYEVRLLDEEGREVPDGEIGNLCIKGGSLFAGYWNRHEVNQRVLQGAWYHTGDKYTRDAEGFYWYCGRADDMLRVSGHWVSPAEVEACLMTHSAVLECAVVGGLDADELTKPRAFVVLREGATASVDLAEELKAHVKARIAPYNYPRWVEFVRDLPKTATGKIQRYRLREIVMHGERSQRT
jgi:benzoate-CoA ligase family protein